MQARRAPAPIEGLAQIGTDANGQKVVALALSPTRPGEVAPSLDFLRGEDLVNLSVRGRRFELGDYTHTGLNLRVPKVQYSLQNQDVSFIEGLERYEVALFDEFPNPPDNPFTPEIFTSDCFMSFDVGGLGDSNTMEFTVTNGTLSSTVNLVFEANDTLRASFNGGPYTTVGRISPDLFQPRIIIPINPGVFSSVPNTILEDYLGDWTFTSDPILVNQNEQEGTPFTVQVRALIVEDVQAQRKPNYVDAEGNEFHGGATFTAKARIAGPPLPPNFFNFKETQFSWHGRIMSPDEGFGLDGIVREVRVGGGDITDGVVNIVYDWDGTSKSGGRFPASHEFGISIWGVIGDFIPFTDGTIEGNAQGPIATGRRETGPKDIFPDAPYDLRISPSHFIPPDEEYVDEDGDGELDWPDYDGDGIPDGFPPEADLDGDGIPDEPPVNPVVVITALPYRAGYTTETWRIHVKDEDGNILPNATLTSEEYGTDRADIYWEWQPPYDLESQELEVVLHVGNCRDTHVPVNVRAQSADTPPGMCIAQDCSGPLAYGEIRQLIVTGRTTERSELEIVSGRETRDEMDEIFEDGLLEVSFFTTEVLPSSKKTIKVLLKTSKSEISVPLTLERVGDDFVGRIDPSLYLKDFSATLATGFDSQAFTIVDPGDREDKPGYSQLQDSNLFASNFLSKGNVELGRATWQANSTDVIATDFPPPDSLNRVRPTKSGFKAAGYETLLFETDDTFIDPPIKIKVRYKNQAPILYYSGHGVYDTNVLELSDRDDEEPFFNPVEDLEPTDWQNVRTAIFAGCSVLDINDYNMNKSDNPELPPYSPGLEWDSKVTGNLLGYNYVAPGGPINTNLGGVLPIDRPVGDDTLVLQKFLFYLDTRFFQNNTAGLDEVALAWLASNYELEHYNACAITSKGYYFVHRRVSGLLGNKIRRRIFNPKIIFVPRSVWRDKELPNFRDVHLQNSTILPKRRAQ